MSKSGITIDELIAEWQRGDEPSGGKTTLEVAKDANISIAMARSIIREAVEAGKLRPEQEIRATPMRAGWRYRANVWVVVE